MLKFFRLPFATSGDKTAVPDAVDTNGNVSYTQGYSSDYQRQKTDPAAKNIERDKMNQVFFDITTAIAELQAQGIPDFITAALNGGVAYSYAQYAIVRYSGELYISLVGANTALPSDNTKWAAISSILKTPPAYSFRNKIINGDMAVSQVNGAFPFTPAVTDTYPIDQWKVDATQASKLTFQQVADAPTGFKFSLKVSVAAQQAPAIADRFAVYQPIEGQNLVDLGLGTAGAAALAVSFWVKSSVPGDYPVTLNNAGTRSYIEIVPVTTSWTKQTFLLMGDTAGSWATDHTIGLQLGVDLGSGSNFNTTAGAWQAGDFTRTAGAVTFVNQIAGATLNITGVQLEAVPIGASSGTPFEYLPYSYQLQRCQRYLPCWSDFSTDRMNGPANTTASALIPFIFKVDTRVPVTGEINTAGLTVGNQRTGQTGPVQALAVSISSTYGVQVTASWAAGFPATNPGDPMQIFGATNGLLYFTGAQL